MKFNEQATVENYIIKYLENKLGYEYIKPKEFSSFREFENEYIITSYLEQALERINNIKDKTIIQSIIREAKKLDTNEEFLDCLRYGINLVDSKTRKSVNYKLVDWEESFVISNVAKRNEKSLCRGEKTIKGSLGSASAPLGMTKEKGRGRNHFVVTNQFYFEGNSENIRPDIMIFLNGLPIVDIEAKSPTASSAVNYEKAIDQIKRYEKVAPKMFLPNCFNIASDGLKTVYGTTYSPKQYFFEWRENDQKNKKKSNTSLDITLDALLSPENLLDIIKNFIVFEKTKEKTVKKIARYQQRRATNKIVQRVKEGKVKRGLIWHTQGSGKSLTMFFTARKLRFDKEFLNPKVFILVDRVDLDDQITDSFLNWGGENVESVDNKIELHKKIVNNESGIFISTM